MSSSWKEPITINVSMSPVELRALADKMEQRFPKLSIGDSTFIDFITYNKDYVVKLFADQSYFEDLKRGK